MSLYLSTPFLHLLRGLVVVAILIGSQGTGHAQVHYEARAVTTPNPTSFVNVPFTTCSNSGQAVPEGAYVRGIDSTHYTVVSIGGAAQETGFCDAYNGSALAFTYTRYLSFLIYNHTKPGLSETQLGSTSASYQRQEVDTSVGIGGGWKYGSGPVNETINAPGEWSFRIFSRSSTSPCNIPTDSASIFRSINAVTCQPTFRVDANNNIGHLPTGTTDIYVDPSIFGSSIDVALTDSISAWNAALDVAGVTLRRAVSSCSSGPNCVPVTVDVQQTSCGNVAASGGCPVRC